MVHASVRIAAVGDLHYTRTSQGLIERAFGAEVLAQADVLALCGDLTDYGLPEEARGLARDLAAVKLPVVAVLGNHDHESGQAEAVADLLRDIGGVTVLDGESCEVRGVGFAGAKGFGGGFGRRVLEPWGEPSIKQFVADALGEAMKLERALSRLRTRTRVALLHYAPIKATVEGEPLEIYPFLGSSRLEEPINRFRVNAVFHGHCHHGTAEGRTTAGIPVYNVAMPVLRRASGDGVPPVKLIELRPDDAATTGATATRPAG